MKVEEQKILNESLSKLFKLDPETLASLYNEAGDLTDFSKVLDADAERIKKYKSDADNQYKRGIREGASKTEKDIKEKYEVESDMQGVELIDYLLVSKIEEAKAAGTKDITKHPDYIKLQSSIDKRLKEKDTEWQTKMEAKEKEIAKEKLFEKVSKRALTNLETRNPILPGDPRKAQVWKDTYLNELRSGNYLDSEGEIIVLNAEGQKLTNAHGHPITFDEYEKDIAEKYFEYPRAEERSNSGNKEQKNSGTGFNAPKNIDDYAARLRDPKITPVERMKLVEWYNLNNLK
jgi:hypothetical protein